jgi:hypothetical protein
LEQHFFGQKRADKAFLTQILDCFAGIFRGLAWSDPGVDWGFYFYINGLWLGWGWLPVRWRVAHSGGESIDSQKQGLAYFYPLSFYGSAS